MARGRKSDVRKYVATKQHREMAGRGGGEISTRALKAMQGGGGARRAAGAVVESAPATKCGSARCRRAVRDRLNETGIKESQWRRRCRRLLSRAEMLAQAVLPRDGVW